MVRCLKARYKLTKKRSVAKLRILGFESTRFLDLECAHVCWQTCSKLKSGLFGSSSLVDCKQDQLIAFLRQCQHIS